MVPFNHDHDLSLTLTYIFNLNDGRDESDLEGSEKQPMLSFSLRNSVHTEILYPVRVMSFITVTETGSNIFKWGNAIRYSFKVKQSTALFWLRVLPLNKPFVIQACEHMASNWWLFSVSCHRWWPADRLPQSISHRFQLINAAKISRTEERKLPRECGGGGGDREKRERREDRRNDISEPHYYYFFLREAESDRLQLLCQLSKEQRIFGRLATAI